MFLARAPEVSLPNGRQVMSVNFPLPWISYHPITENIFGEMDFDLHAVSGGGFVDRQEMVWGIVSTYDIVTGHSEFVNMDLSKLGKVKVIVDGRNCLDKDKIRSLGVVYRVIGRGE